MKVIACGQEVDAGRLVAALYNNSQPLGMGMLHFTPEDMTTAQAQEIIDDMVAIRRSHGETRDVFYFDYLKGRVMKVGNDRKDGEMDGRLYDRDNGLGAFERVVRSL